MLLVHGDLLSHQLSPLQLLSGQPPPRSAEAPLLSPPEGPSLGVQSTTLLFVSVQGAAVPNGRDPSPTSCYPAPCPVSSSRENTCYQTHVNPCFLLSHNISFNFQPHFHPSCSSLDKHLHLVLELLKPLGSKIPSPSHLETSLSIGDAKRVQPLWKTVWLINLITYLLSDPLPGVYPREVKTQIHKKCCMRLFTVAWFILSHSNNTNICQQVTGYTDGGPADQWEMIQQ